MRTLLLCQLTDAVSIKSFFSPDSRAQLGFVQKPLGNLAVVRLFRGRAEPDREPLRIVDDPDLGREPAA